jgi:hypothetical protein
MARGAIMHPRITQSLASDRHAELVRTATESRRQPARRPFPRWNVTWSRTILSPAAADLQVGRKRGSSLIIVITARRTA